MSLLDIIKSDELKANDQIYQFLIEGGHFQDNFLSLTSENQAILYQKKNLYREALKKQAILTYMLDNTNYSTFKNVLSAINYYNDLSASLKKS